MECNLRGQDKDTVLSLKICIKPFSFSKLKTKKPSVLFTEE